MLVEQLRTMRKEVLTKHSAALVQFHLKMWFHFKDRRGILMLSKVFPYNSNFVIDTVKYPNMRITVIGGKPETFMSMGKPFYPECIYLFTH